MIISKYKYYLFLLLIYIYIKNKNLLIKFFINDKFFKREKDYLFHSYLKLKTIELSKNILKKKKYTFIKILFNNFKDKKKIKEIFLSDKCRFGNCIIYLNKYISYCEIIGCKSILLEKKNFWFIKKNITIKNNITIKVLDKKYLNKYFKCKINFNKYYNVKPEIKIDLIRNEIIRNLPNLKLSNKDLYIHIRSDDLFKYEKEFDNNDHIQPPLCFYNNIINNFNFENVYIISSDKGNPVISKLIYYYSNIIFYINKLKYDISILINAYNLVSSTSSFFISALQLNYNIKFLWDYDIYELNLKDIVLHYDLYKFINRNFIIYRMEPSKLYKNIIFLWKNNRRQLKLLLKEKCNNNFRIIHYKTD